ncbi:response regulator [uncultured Abyssibacter sp.]|uniref:response regulator n=1 Tax=uncultured Abyssibacter sp. TaxID=2320202 RepID=UPI0032B128D2
MTRKLNEVLLVDDNEADNFLHRAVVEDADVAEKVTEALNGEEALEYLTTPDENGMLPKPELICLDINMPVMNGWEFLEAYEQLDEELRQGVVIMMLTTSLNPEDSQTAETRASVKAFSNKPLGKKSLMDLLDHHFPGRFDA